MRLDDDSVLLRLVGFVVILVGVGLWPIYLNAEPEPGGSPGAWGPLLVLGGGLACAVIGLTMVLYEGQTVIDRRLGMVVHWQRFLWWRPKCVHDIEDFERVAVVRSKGRHRSWGVELQATSARPECNVLCGLGLTRPDAAMLAGQIAEFSGLITSDSSEVPR